MNAAITHARFVDYDRVTTRKQFKLIFEVPMENADAALRALGGTPITGDEKWCALALLDPALFEKKGQAEQQPASPPPSPEKVPHAPGKLSNDAFWMCKRRDFQEWQGVSGDAAADAEVKFALGIQSKREIDADEAIARKWKTLVDRFYFAMTPEPMR